MNDCSTLSLTPRFSEVLGDRAEPNRFNPAEAQSMQLERRRTAAFTPPQ